MPDDFASVALDAIRARICRVFPGQIHAAADALDDDQIWWRPNEKSNSIGNLVIHLTGSLNLFLNRNLGGIDYTRDRPAEFAERRHIPRAELMAAFDDMVAKAEKTFDGVSLERLGDVSTEPTMYRLVIEDLISIMSHISTHTGQILWIAKMLQEGALDEVWMRTHKRLGGWKPA